MTNEKIISKVTMIKGSGQRRINVPKKEKTLQEDDIVEIKKVEIK